MARETFSSLLNVVLDLRWFAEKGLPGLVKGLSRGIEKVRNNRVIGWLASRTLEPLLKLFQMLGQRLAEAFSGLLKIISNACERYLGARSAYLQGLLEDFQRKPELGYVLTPLEGGRWSRDPTLSRRNGGYWSP